MNKFFFFIIGFLLANSLAAQGYSIKVKLENYDQDTLQLGYYYGNKQYLTDTAILKNGSFHFSDDEPLKAGMYMIVMPPDNNFFQLLINEDEQKLDIQTDAIEPVPNFKIKKSKDNELYYSYLNYLDVKRIERENLEKEKTQAGADEKLLEKIQIKLDDLDKSVIDQQEKIIKEHPKTFTASLLKSNRRIDVPEFEGSPEEIGQKRYLFYKHHYFDHIDLKDARLLRSQTLFPRFDYYVEKLTPQVPDSIIQSIDYLLESVEEVEDTYHYFLSHFLNKYAASKFVGMDAVYVHLVENYYNQGKAPWVDEEQLAKMAKNAKTLKPILIGKIAPDLKMKKEDKTFLSLHEVDSKYTVLFFWDPECGHCKKSIPKIIEFYDTYKSKGVEIFSICTKLGEKANDCWETVKEKKMDKWINVNDPYLRSRFKQIYDVRTTPRIFILDEKKEILSKGIGADQLGSMMEFLLNREAEEMKMQDQGKK
jgi:thiol-disulfide isomerase/thioredoxin